MKINFLLTEVSKAADICFKPFKHSAVLLNSNNNDELNKISFSEINLRIESRDLEGNRNSEMDLELELFRSGRDLNLTLSWLSFPSKPILWHGNYSLWLDSVTGKKIDSPPDSIKLESFARRLREEFSFLIN
tara:strand:- start:492 stop:887 length:396 start_codon:yes stop_codon:yes gene_type:complete